MFDLLVEIAGTGIVLSLIYFLARHVVVGLFGLLAVNFFNLALGMNARSFGRLHLNPLDAVYFVLLSAGIVRWLRGLRALNTVGLVTIGYLLVFVWSLLRGFNANGIFVAANEARGFVGPLLAMLYFFGAPTDEKSVRRYVQGYLAFGTALCAVVVLAALGMPVGFSAWAHSATVAANDRYLPSSAAASIAICGFLALARSFEGQSLSTHLQAPVFFLIAIYLRHRTVWIMLLAGTVTLLFIDGRLFRRTVLVTLLASLAVLGIVLYEDGSPNRAGESEFAASASNAGTWYWRVNGWKEFLFDSDQTPSSILLGKPLGDGWWRIDPESHRGQTAPPHSEYVTEYLRVGLIGLLLVVLFTLGPVIALSRVAIKDIALVYPCSSFWAVAALMTLVYGITYSIEPESYALLGIAGAIALRTRTVEEFSALDETDEWCVDSSANLAS